MSTPLATSIPQGGTRRAIAAIVVAAVPVLYNLPVSAGMQYGAIWGYFPTPWWSNVVIDVALTASCFFMPLTAVVCAGLAIV